MRKIKRAGNQAGFTLIELMIALFITALAIMGYISTNGIIQKNSETAFERSVATQDAHRVIEQMRNAAQSGIFPGNVTGTYSNGGTVAGFTNLTGETITVTYADTTTDPLDATITVTWTSTTGRASTTGLRTLITQR